MARRSKKVEEIALRGCDAPGCMEGGLYRAPKSREKLGEFYWFCLHHVRDYNRSWDYYAGMGPEEIEAEIRRDIVGQRPSWPLGVRRSNWRSVFNRKLGTFVPEDVEESLARHFGAKSKPEKKVSAEEIAALKTLGLDSPSTFAEVRKRYKILAKKYHPDANGGDKKAEEQLKVINHAYAALKAAALRDEQGMG